MTGLQVEGRALIAELERQLSFTRALLSAVPTPVFFKDAKGCYLGCNRAFEELMGVTNAQIQGKTVFELWPSDDAHTYHEKDLELMRHPERQIYEFRVKDKHGEVRPVIYAKDVFYDADGTVAGIVGAFIDISERKRAEVERLSFERQVQQAQKLESLGVLAGGIAHDFNNILMAVLGNADLALLTVAPDTPTQHHLEEIAKAARRASDLARQMLAYSGKGKFVITAIDLNRLVREMSDLLAVSVSKTATLALDLAESLPSFGGDATQIRQVIMNLITNASDAIGKATGTIRVTTGVQRCDRRFLDEANAALHAGADRPLEEGEYVFLEVSDTGCGMDAATLAKVFDPFFSTKFTGRGLGLPVVLGIVRGHRGTISHDSRPHEGTRFRVLFPADGRTLAGARVTPLPPSAAVWRGTGTVLVADDEKAVQAVCARMLETMGFTVLTAADGDEALRVFQAHANDISCVLLDLTMPNRDSRDVLVELRRSAPQLKVVLMSGYSQQDATRRFVGVPLNGFLQKPFAYSALEEVIRRAVRPGSDPEAS